MGALTKIFGTHSERELKRIYPLVDKVESYRDSMQKLSDEELRNKTKEYKERLAKGENLDELMRAGFEPVLAAAKGLRFRVFSFFSCDLLLRLCPVKVRHLFLHCRHT